MAAFSSALVERAATVAPDVGRVLAVNPGYGRNPDPTAGPLHDRPRHADRHDRHRGARRVRPGRRRAAGAQRPRGPQGRRRRGASRSPACPSTSRRPSTCTTRRTPTPRRTRAAGSTSSRRTTPPAKGSTPTAVPTFIDVEPVVTGDAAGITAEAALDPASIENLSSATISYGLPSEDGSVVFFGDEPATISDDGSGIVSGFYDLTILNISDGTDTAIAYISLSTDDESDGFGLDVPMAYYAPGWVEGDPIQRRRAQHRGRRRGHVIEETYYAVDPESGATGELYAEPDGIIVPRLMNVDPAGETTVDPDDGRRPVRRPAQPPILVRAARARHHDRGRSRRHRLRRQLRLGQHARRRALRVSPSNISRSGSTRGRCGRRTPRAGRGRARRPWSSPG